MRDDKIGVYSIKNENTGAFYIGKSKIVKTRIAQRKRALERGDHPNKALQADYNKGDAFRFEILFEVPNSSYGGVSVGCILDGLEMWYILHTNADITGYNDKIGICDSREVAKKRSISPEQAEQLLYSSKSSSLSAVEEYALTLVQELMRKHSWDKDFLYYLLSKRAIQEKKDE